MDKENNESQDLLDGDWNISLKNNQEEIENKSENKSEKLTILQKMKNISQRVFSKKPALVLKEEESQE